MRHNKVAKIVKDAYKSSREDFAQWVLPNHLQFVAKKAEDISKRFNANEDMVVAAAWLHDFGDAFIDRHSTEFDEISKREATNVLKKSGYSDEEIKEIFEVIIEPHSCKDNNLPQTIEGKVLATADALAHLTTDFYVQFAWKHMPAGKSYQEYVVWVNEKLDRDFNQKIFFEEIRNQVETRYNALKEIFKKTDEN